MQNKDINYLPEIQLLGKENAEIWQRLELCDTITYDSENQRLSIPYYHLNGKPFLISKDTPFVRFRNYNPNAHSKYSSPKKSSLSDYKTPLYYPQELIQAYQNGKLKGNTIVWTEGEFKALTAQKHGINCLSFAGISMYKDLDFFPYIKELAQLIDSMPTKAVNIVILYDTDAIELKNLNNDRQQQFNRSAKEFFKVGFQVKSKKKINFFVGHITGENKGLDDVLNVASNPKAIAKAINNPSQPSEFFNLTQVHKTNYNKKIDSLFVCNNLEDFVNRYKSQLLGQIFDFKYKSSISTYQLSDNGKLTAINDFYQHFDSDFDFTFNYSNYAGECLNDIAPLLQIKKRLLLKAATGAGKTTLTKDLEAYYPNGRIFLIEPTRATAKQQRSFNCVIGGNKYDLGNSADSIVTTLSKLFSDNLINQNDYENSLLVIDEAHELYKSFGFRGAECFFIEKLIHIFKNVLATTATPLVPYFKALDFTTVELKKDAAFIPAAQVRICKTRPNKYGKIDIEQVLKDCITESRQQGKTALIYHTSKENHVIRAIAAQDNKTLLLTSNTTKNENKTQYNSILNNSTAFDSCENYDVILTNSVLETGASFNDKNVNVYILFSKSHTEIVQASARFRNVKDVNYIFYIREKNSTGNADQLTNNLKELEAETLKHTDRENPNIQTSLTAVIKTHFEHFSYSKTFNSFEFERLKNQNHYQLIGELSSNFVLNTELVKLPRTAEKVENFDDKIKPCDILNNGNIDVEMISKALSVIQSQPNRLTALEKLDKGYKFFAPAATIKTDAIVLDDTYQVLKLVLYVKDILIKCNIDVDNAFERTITQIDKILNFKELKSKADRFRIVENYILLEALKSQPDKAKDIFNKGKFIAWSHILAIVKNHIGQYSMMDINNNRHLSKLSKAEKYRLLDALNIPQLLIKQQTEQTPSQPRQPQEDVSFENRQINTIKKQWRKNKPLQVAENQKSISPEQNGTLLNRHNCSGLVKNSNSITYKGFEL